MGERKETRKYTFTVEGETEKWYLLWLQNQIRAYENSKYNVVIDAKVQPSPKKFYRRANARTTPKAVHLCDVESPAQEHIERFESILSEMREAKKQKNIQYHLGYSNFTFELWMILHKQACNSVLSHRRQYLRFINKSFGERFKSLDEYKEESNFERCLSKMTLEDVGSAIKRAEEITSANKQDKSVIQYKGYEYYQENPAISVQESVKDILKECGIIVE